MIAPGELTVHTAADATGRTRITDLRQRYPQRVTTALHTDAEFPRAAVLCVQSPSGGTFSDDDLHTAVRCTPGTHLHLTSQAATQVFAGSGPGARHRIEFTVDAGAVLEYLPKTIIPQSDSMFTQTLDVDVEDGGVYIGWDAIAAGRIAHGERFRYAAIDNSFTVRSQGRVLARDRQRITGAHTLDGDYLATLLVVTPGATPAPRWPRSARPWMSIPRYPAAPANCPSGPGSSPGSSRAGHPNSTGSGWRCTRPPAGPSWNNRSQGAPDK